MCACKTHKTVVNYLDEEGNPSYSLALCEECGDIEIDAPDYVMPEWDDWDDI